MTNLGWKEFKITKTNSCVLGEDIHILMNEVDNIIDNFNYEEFKNGLRVSGRKNIFHIRYKELIQYQLKYQIIHQLKIKLFYWLKQ